MSEEHWVNKESLKIAFLITAYGTGESLNRFVSQLLQYENSYIFIHIDKKSKLQIDTIINNERVVVIDQSIDVQWGDYSQIVAVKLLMKFAMKFRKFDYYSVHSESDMLVRPIDELIDFLSRDNAYAYLTCFPLPYDKWQYGGGIGRIALRWPKYMRKKVKWYSPIRYMRSIYGRLYGMNVLKGRKIPNNIQFYGKCDWYTLSEECVNDILKYTELHPEFEEIFVDSLIGSEIYFTTLACNCGRGKKVITDNCLRYIDFDKHYFFKPGSPKGIAYEDIPKIEKSDKYFARKFDENYDSNVINYFMEKTYKK